ncbi:MAG: nucleotidyl transferase AbiEii/AbiGii toxin family protein [Acidobacteria bacterium]|nr:nucleotidyl transferase AbiEii/AbiGii toxin family protein [Acidobacteriota bacterium]
MIRRADIVERVREWGLTEEVVEKDHVLGWVLSGIGAHPRLGAQWVFKGGTCLRKCYIETYRFSEDLDFTVVPGGPFQPDDVLPLVSEVLSTVARDSGINFSGRQPRFRLRPSATSVAGQVYYQGPRQTPDVAGIKIDLSSDERVVRPPVLREIAHPYPDALPENRSVRCYSFEEVFAEKIRAMGQRGRPRDLYDIINLFRRPDLRLYPDAIRAVLVEKCEAKGIPLPTFDVISAPERMAELRGDWHNMLGHQIPALPPFDTFLEELPQLFGWLDGTLTLEEPEAYPVGADEDEAWWPPPTIATWQGAPLEVIRFAATNHLIVELGYHGRTRLIEPYSLRRARSGDVLLHAMRADGSGRRSYNIGEIASARATTTPFRPQWAIEFSAPLAAPPTRRVARGGASMLSAPEHAIECPMCGKRFQRKTRDTTLRPHKASDGRNCSGRRGHVVY